MGMKPVPGAGEGEWTSWDGKERTRGGATGGAQAGGQGRREEEGGSARGAQRASPRRGRVAIGQGGGRRMIPPLSCPCSVHCPISDLPLFPPLPPYIHPASRVGRAHIIVAAGNPGRVALQDDPFINSVGPGALGVLTFIPHSHRGRWGKWTTRWHLGRERGRVPGLRCICGGGASGALPVPPLPRWPATASCCG